MIVAEQGGEGEDAMSFKSLLRLSTAVCALGGVSGIAHAQTAPASGGDTIEEIVVTSGKRAENVQDVPSSVLVVTAAGLERAGVRDFDDIVKVAPSVTITKTSQPANNSINIRGIGTYAYSIATEASVAVVIDDIPQAFQAAAFSALVDVAQVEVLRGPQNTLFGKAASAGVISITTQAPTKTFTGRAEVMATNDHEARVQATVSGPISDTLAFRVAANYSKYRGNIHNVATGDWLNGQSDTTLRAKLVWTPTDDWSVTLSPYITRTLASCCAGAEFFLSPGVTAGKNNIPQATILRGVVPGENNRETAQDVNARGNALDYGSGLKVTRNLNGFTLASISSYDRYYLYDRQDTDGTAFDFSVYAPTAPKGGSGNGGYFKINSVTQEFRLTSPDEGRLKYVAGAYYSRTSSKRYFVRGSNELGTYNGLASLPTTNGTAYSAYIANAKSENFALFGQGTLGLTETLDLIAGLRVNKEKISYKFFDLGNKISYGDPGCSTKSPTLNIQTCNDDTAVTGKVGLRYQPSPDFMTFATYSRGYKGMAYDLTSSLTTRTLLTTGPLKGYPIADAIASQQPIDPETVDSYEIGFKSTLLDRRLTWNVTAFYMDFQGFQAQSRDLITNQNVLNSIGKVTSKGVETEFSAKLGHGLSVNGGGSYNKAVMNDFPNASCFAQQTGAQGCVGGLQDLSGKPLFNAPEWNANINALYERQMAEGYTGFVNAGFRWQSAVIFNLLQDPDSVQNDYGIFNLSGGVQTDRWKLTAFVNNLFDKSYALTKGRSAQWNVSQTTNPTTNAVNWKPARDSERYVGARFSISY
jgi:iron complex outermembrane receptor protein